MAGVAVGDAPPPLTEEQENEEGRFLFVDPGIELDLNYIRIAEVLGVPAPEVAKYPAHWSGAASILLEARGIVEQRRAKKAKK